MSESEPILPEAVRRVEMEAMRKGLPIRVVRTRETARSAQEAANAVGTSVERIVKSLVFRGKGSGRAYLLLVSGAHRVAEAKAEAALGEAVERPDAAFVRAATGFAIGGVAPIGGTGDVTVVMDRRLLEHPSVWAAAGTPFHVFEVEPHGLRDAAGAIVADLV